MKRYTILKQGRRVALAACSLLIGAAVMQSCKDDDILLTGQPSWLGNSIYERLQNDPNGDRYTVLLRLIDDLGQTEVLSHTGSKTIFAANDEAFAKWFSSNRWGVKSYEQLSESQKKALLNSTMINNAYLMELLTNVTGTPPMEGLAMRRETAASLYDSVMVMSPQDMPKSKFWNKLRQRGKAVPVMMDATEAPMIHFLPAFMKYYGMTDSDLSMLTNGRGSSISEMWVSGSKVKANEDNYQGHDIVCKNGYIHKIEDVIEPSINMAEIVRGESNTKLWSSMLDRFSAPYYDATASRNYNRIYNTTDSVYVFRYLSDRSAGGVANKSTQNNDTVKAYLKFDPGWNQYMYSNTMDYDLHYDAAALFVPTDSALLAWWNGEGRDLQQEYKELDSIPMATLAKLLRVNQSEQFTTSFPSKFDNVLDDAKETLGIKPENVQKTVVGCNGVVYILNKVFAPAEYASVAYPALAHESLMNIIYWVLSVSDQNNKKNTFLPYMLSMDSQYALMLPTNQAMMTFVDPATYGNKSCAILEFYIDQGEPEETNRLKARRYGSTITDDGVITRGYKTQDEDELSQKVLNTRLDDIMNQLIIVLPNKGDKVTDYMPKYEYFKSKGGTLMRIYKTADDSLAVSGAWQIEHQNHPIKPTAEFDKQNGTSYELPTQVPMASTQTVYLTLQDHPEYERFFELMTYDKSGLFNNQLDGGGSVKYNCGNNARNNKNLTLLDNYNYTIYVPTNESIDALIASNKLPTWDDYEAQTADLYGGGTIGQLMADTAKIYIKERILKFLRYHIHDHSVAVKMLPEDIHDLTPQYESMLRNPETGRYFPISVDMTDPNELTVSGFKEGNTAHVVKTEGLYNNICREYWWKGDVSSSDKAAKAEIFMTSDAVLHQIDTPLLYGDLPDWKEEVKKLTTR